MMAIRRSLLRLVLHAALKRTFMNFFVGPFQETAPFFETFGNAAPKEFRVAGSSKCPIALKDIVLRFLLLVKGYGGLRQAVH